MSETAQSYITRILSNLGDRDPWDVLESTAATLYRLVGDRSPAALAWTPDPRRWSTVQILAHLADAEIVAAWRLRSILATDNVRLQAFDQNLWSEAFDYAKVDPMLSLDTFAVNRRATLALLRRVSAPRLEHAGLHDERGREPVVHLVRLYAGHDLNHVSQIEKLLAAAPA